MTIKEKIIQNIKKVQALWLKPLTDFAYVKFFVYSLTAIIVSSTVVVFLIDPYIYYHRSIGLRQVYADSTAMIPGVLKHYEYDTVLFGSSMVQNFHIGEMNKILGCNGVKATSAGLTAETLAVYFETALKHKGSDLKRCIMGIDFFAFAKGDQKIHTRYNYLYGDDLFVPEYFYSKNTLDAVLEAIITNIAYPFDKIARHQCDCNMMFSSKPRYSFGRKYLERDVRRLSVYPTPPPADIYQTFDKLLFKHIRSNPEIHFDLFLPPYSIYFWCLLEECGQFDDYMKIRLSLAEEIARYPNARLHDFQWDGTITGNFENYKDITHYSGKVNTQMLESMANGKHQLTLGVPQMKKRNSLIKEDVRKYKTVYLQLRKK